MTLKSIAIDGPSGAGKSSLARRTAEEMKLIYVDTGAIYRTVGLAARDRGISLGDAEAVSKILPELVIEMKYDAAGVQRMYLNGTDVSEEIRQPQISMYASNVSAMPEVREFLLQMQRGMAEKYDVIMDGRDIGTVVLPKAQLKIFLTASPEIRAKRRHLELMEKGDKSSYDEVLRDIITRDYNDSHRDIAPLKQAEDALLLDTSELNFDESLHALLAIIKERFGEDA